MYVLILYYSKSGNTGKLARFVEEGVQSVPGVDAILKTTQEVTKEDFVNAAGVIAGSPVYFGVMAADLKRVFDEFVGVRKQMENKVGAAFEIWLDKTYSIDVSGTGQPSEGSVLAVCFTFADNKVSLSLQGGPS